ncbi:hypothetical protein OsI_36334 [Oryza sativa Indica Group]|uniref:Chalcone/stilbene synthase N-terminal domain-containing protein n=1 Tax=Oryza sativa subsp. indica TaxID=39946 RepID=B8BKU9_ORYSI|nr:hypothetical protein OsI_36334 [Oryza sativa Indica Group]
MLVIGTANPPNSLSQEEYTDWYFRVTNSDHLTNLKDKMKKICHRSGIKKRHFHHTDDTFRDHPELAVRDQQSLETRQDILATAVPELAAEAAARAITEWGRPASDVTHLLRHAHARSRRRAPRAKDLAENNPGERVLVVSAELSLTLFRAPQEGHVDTIVGQALFGDGAGAVIVGAGGDERQVF